MNRRKTTISQADSYEAIGEYWDAHDLGEVWDQTRPVEMEFAPEEEAVLYRVETALSRKIQNLARRKGVSAETLLNLWAQEKLAEQS